MQQMRPEGIRIRFGAITSIRLRLAAIALLAGMGIRNGAAGAWREPEIKPYPEAVIRMTGGQAPFTPNLPGVPFDFPLKPLLDSQYGTKHGVGLRLTLEILGEKLFLVDTAARGLLLKSEETEGAGIVRIPSWIQPGPGVQTGLFRIFPRLFRQKFSLAPAVAELMPASGFPGIDGIISTGILAPWVVRLNLPKNRLALVPRDNHRPRPDWEWPAALDQNWWVVRARIRKRPALLLLDTGAGRTYLSEAWLRSNFPDFDRRSGIRGAGRTEIGAWEIEIEGAPSIRRPLLKAPAAQIPVLQNSALDGVLGFDVLRELRLEFDYRGGKIYLLRRDVK